MSNKTCLLLQIILINSSKDAIFTLIRGRITETGNRCDKLKQQHLIHLGVLNTPKRLLRG
jgi:hypothetical protein